MVPVRRNQNWLPSIFNDFLGNDWLAERHNTTAPAVNIIEDENEYKVEVAAPGMTKEDFKVHINEDNELIVTMEKKAEQKEEDKKKGTYLRREFSYTKFQQSLAAARQRRAREDRGQGRERRDDHRDSQEERDGSRRCGPPDRGQIACGHSRMGRENPLNGFSFFCDGAVATGRWRSAGMRNERNGGREVACRLSAFEVENGVGTTRRVQGVARDDAETHPCVESRGLRVLFVHIHASHSAMDRDVLHEFAPQTFPARGGRDEQHFEPVGSDARKGCESVSGIPYDIDFRSRKRLLAHHAAEKGDVLRSQKVVRGAYRPLPQIGKCVEFVRSRRCETLDHDYKIVTGCLRRVKLRVRAAAKGVWKLRAPTGHPLTQAQQRIQRAGSVCASSPRATACVGQIAAQRPQWVQRSASHAGR